ncbi:MAG: ATP-binding cassette domain-containing protein, partial [Chloroflexota bacterium]|nr:ATP-binding cassette domain-containing protein [Chloroflexota bacterium]
VKNFTGAVMRGDVLGFIGPNGSGKSTFIKTLLADHPIGGGELRVGGTVTAAYYRQDLSQLPAESSIYQSIAELRPRWERRLIQGHLGRFGFSGDEVQRRIGSLSGGEQARVALAMLMLSGANLLVLDEPTNHLDVESIEALEDAIERYDGTVLLVSHDRELLRALTTKVWVLHDTRITEFPDGFADWEEISREREHAARVQASEEQALNRVHERQRVARGDKRGAKPGAPASARSGERAARKKLEETEARVNDLEAQVAVVTRALENPELYTRPNGPAEAKRLGARLDELKAQLDRTLEEWTEAGSRLAALE